MSVKIRYSDFETYTTQKSIPNSIADHSICKVAKDLFTKLYTRRQLIRMIGISFTDLMTGTYQIKIFDDLQEMIKLNQVIDTVKKYFGERFVVKWREYPSNLV